MIMTSDVVVSSVSLAASSASLASSASSDSIDSHETRMSDLNERLSIARAKFNDSMTSLQIESIARRAVRTAVR